MVERAAGLDEAADADASSTRTELVAEEVVKGAAVEMASSVGLNDAGAVAEVDEASVELLVSDAEAEVADAPGGCVASACSTVVLVSPVLLDMSASVLVTLGPADVLVVLCTTSSPCTSPFAPAGALPSPISSHCCPVIPYPSAGLFPSLYFPDQRTFLPGRGNTGSVPSTVEHSLNLAFATKGDG